MSLTSDEAGTVRHALDEATLAAYLRAHVQPFEGELSVKQFGHGQSNPTYLLDCGQAYRCVLRKQPHGKILHSAHAIDREYRVMAALKRHSDVPVPEMLAFCADPSVLGTPFFVMEFVSGRIFKEPTLETLRPLERFAIYHAVCDTLARIHRVDWRAIEARTFSRPNRQPINQSLNHPLSFLTHTIALEVGVSGKHFGSELCREVFDWLTD